ncbi:hypothetical protein BDR26DRAFT_875462 [Obelidium mucronatum]|nr:hypothetical protein BDR26DRAFT_875462 [Obelidium mucronatum]
MDSHTATIVGAVGGCVLVVAGVAAVRQRGSKAQTVSNRAALPSTSTLVPHHAVIQMSEVHDAPPPLMELEQPTPTSATSATSHASDATSATSVSSMDIGTPYTTLPMGGFHRESMKPMMEVESTHHGGYILQQTGQVQVGQGSEKMIKSLIQ